VASRSGRVRGTYRSKKTGKSERYDSSYELRRFKALDASPLVRTWTKSHNIRIRYQQFRKRRRYFPDILVERVDGSRQLEEVKGHVWDPLKFKLKNLAARLYCERRDIEYRILYEADLDVVV
jgi:hypothetical protein